MVNFKVGDKVYVYGNPKVYKITKGYCLGTITDIYKQNNGANYATVNFNIISWRKRNIICDMHLKDLHLFNNKKGNVIW